MDQRRVRKSCVRFVVLSVSFSAVVSLAAQAATAPVGATPGSFSVDPNGGANYTIPIQIPPGSAGMAPSVALTYSKQVDNPLVGVGFSISGLSIISRCGSTKVLDGIKGGVYYDSRDRFCLDGQRLIAVNGADGALGTEYRTERESFARIFSYDTSVCGLDNNAAPSSGPACFKAFSKDGTVSEYGVSPDSRIQAAPQNGMVQTTVRLWALNRVQDTRGNYYTVSYAEDNTNGEYRPLRIDYTGNANAGLAPYNSVRFVYGSRTDIVPHYEAGSVIKVTQRLTNVQTYADATLVRSYNLGYDNNGVVGRSRLRSVTECAGDQVSCLPPMTFDWQDGTSSGQLIAGNNPATGSALINNWNWSWYSKQIADVNGDGRSDVVLVAATTGGLWVYTLLANGDGSYQLVAGNNPATGSALINNWNWSWYSTQIADVNGDGRSDVVLVAATKGGLWVYTLLANGDGSYQLVAGNNPATGSALFNNWDWSWYSTQIADVNGDGRSDVVLVAATKGGLWVYTLLGKGDGTYQLVAGNDPATGSALFNNWDWSWYSKQIADVNGDGRSDVVLVAATSGGLWVYTITLASGLFPDLLSRITNGLSAATNVAYKPFTDNSVYTKDPSVLSCAQPNPPLTNLAAANVNCYPYQNVQNATYVVSRVTQSDEIGGLRGTSYKYAGAKSHLTGPGWLGFRRMETTDEPGGIPSGIVSVAEYDQRYEVGLNGMPALLQTKLGARTLKQVQNFWQGVATTDPAYPAASQVRFAKLNGTLEQNFEPNLLAGSDLISCVSADNTFGAYGDITQTIARTDASCSFASAWVKTTTSSYCPGPNELAISDCPAPSSRILGRLSRAQVTASALGVLSQTRTSSFGYDARGLLTTETIEPDEPASSTLRLATTHQYNEPYGNRSQSTVTGANPDATTFSRTTSFGYDSRGRYVESTTNALGHLSTATHDARWGTVLSQADPNNVTVSFGYDGFGRKTSETRPDGTTTSIAYAACDTLSNPCPSFGNGAVASYTVTTQSSGAAPATAYVDLLGRTLRTQTVGLNGAAVYRDTEYDNQGRVARSTLPYFAGAFVYWNTNGYDALSRLTQVTEADAGITATSYQGLTTVVTGSGPGITARSRTSVKNAANQLVSVSDSLYPTQSTAYQYDAFGSVTRVTDPAGNVTLMSYDRRGRKETMADPDMGSWNYGYDSLGELMRQTDAKGQPPQTVLYDPLGRIQSRTTPEGTSTWTYDSAPLGTTGLLAKGRLASVSVPGSVQQSYGYDNLGRPSSSTLTVDGTAYPTSTTYNLTNGQIETVTYPQTGFAVKRVYNANGYLFELRNAATNQLYWTASQDDAAGRLTQERLNNNLLTTDRVYDPAKGTLTRINTYGAPGTAQDLRYDFDVLGNLLSRFDFLQGTTETFGYDTLDRLLSVTGPASKSFQYDAIGNITSKSDVGSYAYTGGKPHAVTQAGPNGYTYDPNGNQLTGPGRSVVYASFNKASSITKDGLVTTFSYDAGFNRVKKSNVNGTTVYVGKLYERVVRGTVTEHKHYIHGGAAPVAVYTQRNTGVNDTRYLHTDHLGSVVAITDESGTVVQRLSYDVYGKRRNPDWTDPIGPIASLTPRGFTGHEMDDESGLINMNAREYDPVIGRFLSADTIVEAGFGQGLNRYSYARNNPLSYTDPTGMYSLGDVISIFDPVFAVAKDVNDHKDDIARQASRLLNNVSGIPYVGQLASIALLTSDFGYVYGWSTGDWKSVGRAHATGAVLAASFGAGAAAWAAYSGSLLGAGIFVAESAAIGYASSYATARINGASNDEARHAALLAAKRGAVSAVMRIGYQAMWEETDRLKRATGIDTGPCKYGPGGPCIGGNRLYYDDFDLNTGINNDVPSLTGIANLGVCMEPCGSSALFRTVTEYVGKVHDFTMGLIGGYTQNGFATWSQIGVVNDLVQLYNWGTMIPSALYTGAALFGTQYYSVYGVTGRY